MTPMEPVSETAEMEGPVDSVSIFSDYLSGSGRSRSTLRSRRRARRREERRLAEESESRSASSTNHFANLVAVSAAIVLLANVAFPSTPAGAAVRRMAGAGLETAFRATVTASEWASSENGGGTRGYGRSLGHEEGGGQVPSASSASRQSGQRPVMHTFFHRIDPSKKGTAMSDRADREMLEVWRNAWYDAGYDPIVLTLDDAKRHPEYRRYSQKLQAVPMMGRGGQGLNIFYNQLCYYRWLSMAVAGGGWMVDYDVFPLHPHQPSDDRQVIDGGADPSDPDSMPNGGDFTVYQFSGKGEGGKPKGVPAMMSGRGSEWTRMAQNILEDGLHHTSETMWTDFFALMDVAGTYQVRDDVVQGQHVLTGNAVTQKDCEMTLAKRAVHFSHNAMEKGVLPEGQHKVEDRPRIVSSYLQAWRRECGSSGTGGIGAQGQPQQQLQPDPAVERQRQAEAAAAAAEAQKRRDRENQNQANAPPAPQTERQTKRTPPKGEDKARQAQAQAQAQQGGDRRAQEKPQKAAAQQKKPTDTKVQEQQAAAPVRDQSKAQKP